MTELQKHSETDEPKAASERVAPHQLATRRIAVIRAAAAHWQRSPVTETSQDCGEQLTKQHGSRESHAISNQNANVNESKLEERIEEKCTSMRRNMATRPRNSALFSVRPCMNGRPCTIWRRRVVLSATTSRKRGKMPENVQLTR